VTAAKNPLYYKGWYFNSPTDLKAHNDFVKEYNLRVNFRNQINEEYNKVVVLYNNATNQAEADKYQAVLAKLLELRTAQEAELNNIMGHINGLAKSL
jgi:hypothetical protein